MKQAVVVIHGIGEQRPMDTLHGFVDAMIPADTPDGTPFYWSKPDRLSRNFDLRVLKSSGRTSTDFYEYYWAHKMQGTKVGHLLSWLWDIFKRPRRDIPDAIVPIWRTTRWTVMLLVLLIASGTLATAWGQFDHGDNPFALVPLLLGAIGLALRYSALSYLGDAARYLSPNPQNVVVREQIRADGVALLRALHNKGDYDRIIVVGHSLGSVIAYDIVGYLWHEHHDQLTQVIPSNRELASRYANHEALQPVIKDTLPNAGAALDGSLGSILKFREQQTEAFIEQRGLGNPWRITDLVTVGSPMAHASLLLGRSVSDFQKRMERREAPACPPTQDEKGYGYNARHPVMLGQKPFTPQYLHHAAAFAVTRWTNLYFPAPYGLFGDIVAGPVSPVMGAGVLDLPVTVGSRKGWLARSWLSHTHYWSERGGAQGYLGALSTDEHAITQGPRPSATEALRWAVDLKGLRRLRPARAKESLTQA
ncbi:lipase family protein [Pseudomonas sp. 14P_5.3_Bac1]|uniref:lipase family protein n=1 Tax=Pseudomonas sp. 14P_5.3_Bac1 TaxID=2971622 RepID=UPI0021CA29D2|nr:lipase family protein [Pseudomonas sp. 14P_5.3_Bac1]MCU1778611.1 lipase family protein [Pseudomonas sp. 14P_5.3_Bac1]